MNKAFILWLWEDFPSVNTALNAYHLNLVNKGLNEVDNRIIALDTNKASLVDISTLFKDVSYNQQTGIITYTRYNGATVTIDTPMEKIQTGIYYNPATEKLVLPLIDGTSMEVDLSRLMKFDEFVDSDTIAFSVKSNGTVTAIVKEGSIQEKHLQPNYLANIKVESAKAEASALAAANSALLSESWAVGNTGVRDGENTNSSEFYCNQSHGYRDEAQQAAESATDAVEQINKKLELAEFDIDDDGNLIYTDGSSYVFTVDDDGMLNWEVA